MIDNLKINIDSKYENDYPGEFSIQFNQFNVEFNIAFTKMSPNDNTYPIQSTDAYVIFLECLK